MNNEEKKQPNIPDFNKLEQDILQYWDEHKTFEKSLEQTERNESGPASSQSSPAGRAPQADIKPKPPYVFYDGPPFATGLPHYGHILASTVKDLFGRYHTMKGEYVRRVWGWDCHGLPIENIVEQLLKISGKKQIEEIGVEKFNQACRENVLRFVDEWGRMVKRMGRWVDFENSYKTMDTSYQESVWAGLKALWGQGLIYEDRKVLLYCSRCETPISNFEVAQDNSYRDVTEESVYAKFKLVPHQRISDFIINDQTYVLAWTTTPWTLPGNTALNIGPDITYVLIEQNNEQYVLAKDRLEIIQGSYEVKQEFSARSLEGLQYEPLYELQIADFKLQNGETGKFHKIYIEDYVTATDGTGVVHNAAMYGEEDYEVAKQRELPRVDMLNSKGEYVHIAPEFLRGMFFKDAEKPVLQDLATRNLVYKTQHYTHSYPHCHRCGTPLFYNALPAWFINIQKIKPALLKANETVNWYPEHLKHGRFSKSMEQAPDWNISRNRYWATALPFWKCQNGECGNMTCVGSIDELREKSKNFDEVYPGFATQKAVPFGTASSLNQMAKSQFLTDKNSITDSILLSSENLGGGPEGNRTPESGLSRTGSPPSQAHLKEVYQSYENLNNLDLHRPYIDKVVLKCDKCTGEMQRISEVVDCWVESASMPFAELHAPFENEDLFKKRFPADFVAEYIGQTRAWFYVMHALNTALFGQAPFKNVVTTGNMLAESGEKLSKSKMNYTDPWINIEKYGIDAIRFYLLSLPVMSAEDATFSDKGVDEVYKKLNMILYNVWSFYRMYAKKGGQWSAVSGQSLQTKHVLDVWMVSRLRSAQEAVTSNLDNYNTVKVCREILDLVSDLSTWYVRRSRDRIKAAGQDGAKALEVLGYALAEIAKLLAPIMPFLSEFIYRDITGKESVHLETWTENREGLDKRALEQMWQVRDIVSLALSARKAAGISVRQPLAGLSYQLATDISLSSDHEQLILDELNVKKIDDFDSLKESIHTKGQIQSVKNIGSVKEVLLNLEITPELKLEGYARELERAIQDLRKKSGLTVGDTVDIYYNTQEDDLVNALLNLVDRRKVGAETITQSLEIEADNEVQFELDNKAIWFGIVFSNQDMAPKRWPPLLTFP